MANTNLLPYLISLFAVFSLFNSDESCRIISSHSHTQRNSFTTVSNKRCLNSSVLKILSVMCKDVDVSSSLKHACHVQSNQKVSLHNCRLRIYMATRRQKTRSGWNNIKLASCFTIHIALHIKDGVSWLRYDTESFTVHGANWRL